MTAPFGLFTYQSSDSRKSLVTSKYLTPYFVNHSPNHHLVTWTAPPSRMAARRTLPSPSRILWRWKTTRKSFPSLCTWPSDGITCAACLSEQQKSGSSARTAKSPSERRKSSLHFPAATTSLLFPAPSATSFSPSRASTLPLSKRTSAVQPSRLLLQSPQELPQEVATTQQKIHALSTARLALTPPQIWKTASKSHFTSRQQLLALPRSRSCISHHHHLEWTSARWSTLSQSSPQEIPSEAVSWPTDLFLEHESRWQPRMFEFQTMKTYQTNHVHSKFFALYYCK